MTHNANLPTYYLAHTYTNNGNHNNCLYIYENFYNRKIIPLESSSPRILKSEVEGCYHILSKINKEEAELLIRNLNQEDIANFLKRNLTIEKFFFYDAIFKTTQVINNYKSLMDLRIQLGSINQSFFLYKHYHNDCLNISNIAQQEVDSIKDGLELLNKVILKINKIR